MNRAMHVLPIIAAVVLSLAACDRTPSIPSAPSVKASITVQIAPRPDLLNRPDSLLITAALRNDGQERIDLGGAGEFGMTQQIRSSDDRIVWQGGIPPMLPFTQTFIESGREFRVARYWNLRSQVTGQPVPAGNYIVQAQYVVVLPEGDSRTVVAQSGPTSIRLP
jgi:hypothetical protein